MMERNTAAVVVLYNPKDDVLDNIFSYLDQVSKVYAIDNSVSYNAKVIEGLKAKSRIEYHALQGNLGIAYALNVGAKKALAENFLYLLTMDQDTFLPENYVTNLFSNIQGFDPGTTGIVAPQYEKSTKGNTGVKEILYTMTSGNVLNLNSYKNVGEFKDDLFIDHVDHEYCLRLNSKGYKVLEVAAVQLAHKPGNKISKKWAGGTLDYSSHSPFRLYYFCRNGFYVSRMYEKMYPEFKHFFRTLLFKELSKIVIFEKNKIKRLAMLKKGFEDFKKNKLGALRI